MNEQPAEFDAEVFLGERLVGDVLNNIVAVLNAVRSAARWNEEAIVCARPGRPEAGGNCLRRGWIPIGVAIVEDVFRGVVVVGGLVIEPPNAQ